jgi:uncharacterized protein
MLPARPTDPGNRIALLDSVRGFAVLGILLMNIIGFGLLSPAYSWPGFDVDAGGGIDRSVWVVVELFGEGSMRGLFSLLFGAGVVLFTTGETARGAAVFYRRMLLLLLFGLLDAYVLLWYGDILVCYALCGALLYPLRNWRARSLLLLAAVLLLLSSLSYAGLHLLLEQAREAAQTVAASANPGDLEPRIREAAQGWLAFSRDYFLSPEALQAEAAARAGSYLSAFTWNVGQTNAMLFFVLPLFLLWDALLMMLLGMALYKLGVLSGRVSAWGGQLMALLGLTFGLVANGLEVASALRQDLDLLSSFAQLSWSYHLGRLGMSLGYIGLFAWLLHLPSLSALTARLAAVGRMALSNYLLHSLIALLLFTGAGFGLVGELSRAQLYLVVVAIWLLQLWLSPLWLARQRFGPLEYLWRWLTYGARPGR